jgi:protein-tyrosine kinase
MSIIEKAVSKLEEQSASAREREGAANKRVVEKAVQQDFAAKITPDIPVRADVTASDAVQLLNIPIDDLHSLGMVTPAVPRSRIAEEFRTIKRPLLKNISGESALPVPNANLIMVTSAIEGDGKTYASVSLAVSIAMEMDKTVLFIDADVVKGSAGRLLGVPNNSPGLMDLLENKGVGVGDVMLRTNIPKLSVIPTGNTHEHSNELLASDAMKKLMLELSQRYSDRVIIFDSPPLLLTTEAGVLASFMGQVVFVVAADQTPQQAVIDALEHIGEDKVVGMVLNKTRKRRVTPFGSGYDYGYGYGYGSRGRGEERSTPSEKTG